MVLPYVLPCIQIQTQTKQMAKKSNRITMQVAIALAEQVADNIREVKNNTSKRNREEFKKTRLFKQLQGLNKKANALNKQVATLERKGEKDYNVNIYCGDSVVDVSSKCHYISPVEIKAIKNAIVMANQIKGIGVDDLVSYVTKEQLSKKQPSTCS